MVESPPINHWTMKIIGLLQWRRQSEVNSTPNHDWILAFYRPCVLFIYLMNESKHNTKLHETIQKYKIYWLEDSNTRKWHNIYTQRLTQTWLTKSLEHSQTIIQTLKTTPLDNNSRLRQTRHTGEFCFKIQWTLTNGFHSFQQVSFLITNQWPKLPSSVHRPSVLYCTVCPQVFHN